jgi:hypothetical protein
MPTTSVASTPEPMTAESTLDLHIADPASLLNEIARRYESVERILMEYVDNALDDAEVLYRANAEAYPFGVHIQVIIDPARGHVRVRDNCRGMKKDTLERIVRNVGQSGKKGLTWVNGQFGFGVHAFRAAAEAIEFRTKHADGDHLELKLRRDQHRGIRRPWASPDAFPSDTRTGTEVTIGPFDPEWAHGISVESVKHEIETHFERLLARPNLLITVQEGDGMPVACEPFDYSRVPGEDYTRTLDLELGDRLHLVEVHLKVAELEVSGRRARFFRRGRRINEVAEIKSFIRKSEHRTSVWGHPNLLGYIEVGELAQPVITRDDFQRNKGRTVLYEAILALEDEVKAALDRVNQAHRDNTLNRLEDVMRDVLEDLAREDRLRLRSELGPGRETGRTGPGGGGEGGPERDPRTEWTETTCGSTTQEGDTKDTGPDPKVTGSTAGDTKDGYKVAEDPSQAQGARRPRSGFEIKFVNLPPDAEGRVKRSHLVDGTISINKLHPDFAGRMNYDRQGRPKFTDRLGGYLAATVSIHYKDQFYARYGRQPDRRDQLFDEQVEFICRFEDALREHLPVLERELAGQNGNGAAE